MASDIELLTQYRAGSESAFAALLARHVDWVYSAAARRVGDAHLAEDVTQAVFIALSRSARVRAETAVSAWLFQVLRFTSAKAVRTEARRRRHETEAAAQRHIEHSGGQPQWDDLAPLLDQAVARLRRRDRQAILLRFYERRSLAEVAAALAISQEGARKRVARAVAKLRQDFAGRGLTMPEAALATAMESNVAQAAPDGLAAHFGQSPRAVSLFEAWRKWIYLQLLLKMACSASLALMVIVASTIGIWRSMPGAPRPSTAAMLQVDPPSANESPILPTDVTLAQITAGVRQSEHEFQNIYVKDFQTTVDRLPKGKTDWIATRERYSGSAWFDAQPWGRVRIYFADAVRPWQRDFNSPAMSWAEGVSDLSWNGAEGRELRVASQSSHGGMMRQRQAMLGAERPGFLDRYARWETGLGFTLEYLVTAEDGAGPPQSRHTLSQLLERAAHYPGAWEIKQQKINGFNTVKLNFPGPLGHSTYWFDSSRGFALVKYEYTLDLRPLHNGDYVRTEGFEVQQFKEPRPGVWFPTRAYMVEDDLEHPGSSRRYNYQAADAVANDPKFDPAIFTANIPAGWLVNDDRSKPRKEFVTMEDGSELPIETGEPVPRVKAGVAERPDGNTPGAARQEPAWW